MSNLGPACEYCYESAVEPIDMPAPSLGTVGRCKSVGYPVCCHIPSPGEPGVLRLAFWHKPGTRCDSFPLGNVPCPAGGDPLIALKRKERADNKRRRIDEQNKKQKEREYARKYPAMIKKGGIYVRNPNRGYPVFNRRLSSVAYQRNFRRLMSQDIPPPGTFKTCGQMIAYGQTKMPVGASPQCSATLLGECCNECTYDQSTAQCQACGRNALFKNIRKLQQMKCVTFSAPNSFDEAEQNVGGGKIYGEYNKGPVKVGGEWDFDEAQENVGGFSAYGEYNKGPVKVGGEWNFDEAEQNVGGGKIYGEYNKGPVKVGGEWEFDEEDQSVGYDDFGQPSHTRPHMPDGNSIGNWINFRL